MKDNSNKAFWERFAGIYGSVMSKNDDLYDDIANRIKLNLSKDMRVLELGCGTGQLSFKLADNTASYEATDFSNAMIEESRKSNNSERLNFQVMDATDIKFADDSFDAVIIANTLHIMPEPEKALKEIKRVLKNEGILFAPTFINGKGFFFVLRTTVMGLGGFKVFFKWSKEEFEKYIDNNGFKIVTSSVIGGNKLPLCYLEAKNRK